MELTLPKGYEWYSGGAPLRDSSGKVYVAGLSRNHNVAKTHPDYFRFRVFRYDSNGPVQIPLQVYPNGHGSIFVEVTTGKGMWYAFLDGVPHADEIPGFAPITGSVVVNGPDTSALEARVQNLAGQVDYAVNVSNSAYEKVKTTTDSVNGLTKTVQTLMDALDKKVSVDTVADIAWAKAGDRFKQEFDALWERFLKYTDTRFRNAVWDLGIRQLRYKERTGKTAEQMPVNDRSLLD